MPPATQSAGSRMARSSLCPPRPRRHAGGYVAVFSAVGTRCRPAGATSRSSAIRPTARRSVRRRRWETRAACRDPGGSARRRRVCRGMERRGTGACRVRARVHRGRNTRGRAGARWWRHALLRHDGCPFQNLVALSPMDDGGYLALGRTGSGGARRAAPLRGGSTRMEARELPKGRSASAGAPAGPDGFVLAWLDAVGHVSMQQFDATPLR